MEIWKPIKEYEGLYEVSSFGNIKSLVKSHYNGHHFVVYGERTLKKSKDKDGYLRVCLCKNNKKSSCIVHRLVAEAFIPNTYNLPHINHKDEIKTNNCVENLEWCDNKYNDNYGDRNNKISNAVSKSVLQFDLNGNLIKKWKGARQVQKELGFFSSNISKACKGELITAYGYKWEFEKES